jgi:GlcNAc-PI de-N-acetylase
VRKEMPIKRFLIISLAFAAAAFAQSSPYSNGRGARAISQEIREIRNPSVYLLIAVAPGFEDLASIAKFKIGSGAAVSVVFVTNGEDISSDLNGEMFYQLASRRKEEAYQALSYLGVQPYFLNIPVNEFSPGSNCFEPTTGFAKVLDGRLDSLIEQIKPDVIVIDRDPLSGTGISPRLSYLRDLVERNIRRRVGSSLWNVKRLFIQVNEGRGINLRVGEKDKIWAESYVKMAHDADGFYASLKYQSSIWDKSELHRYVQLFPKTASSTLPMDKGLPKIGAELKRLLPIIRSTLSLQRISSTERQLAMLHGTIASVDAFISRYEYSIGKSDLRVLSTWKSALERLRCTILRVSIPYSVSDTVVTPIQLFFLRFGELAASFDKGKTQIFFPGVIQKQWIVDEAQNSAYNWKDSVEFRVLSPKSIQLNSPETPEGFEALQVRTPFVFIIVHRDSNPNHDFMFRAEIPLIIAPIRSVEVLTPRVAMLRDADIRVRFASNTRDKSGGAFYVSDSLVSSSEKRVELPGKNYILTDTLPLIWKDTSLAVPRKVEIFASGNIPIGSFVIRNLDVKSDVSRQVGLCSVVENGPVLTALRRLGVSTRSIGAAESRDENLSDYSAIIIDQFSLRKFVSSSVTRTSIEQWIRKGGKLIILPQYGVDVNAFPFMNHVGFAYLPVVGCGAEINIDSTEKVFRVPNEINKNAFVSDPFVISYGRITNWAGESSKALIWSGAQVLLSERTIGKGAIFYCALNLYPKLLEIDQNSYRLLANLLNY